MIRLVANLLAIREQYSNDRYFRVLTKRVILPEDSPLSWIFGDGNVE